LVVAMAKLNKWLEYYKRELGTVPWDDTTRLGGSAVSDWAKAEPSVSSCIPSVFLI
jgi:hypothetical protein